MAERLVRAGADITAVGNTHGLSPIAMAEPNEAMQDALRRLGAS